MATDPRLLRLNDIQKSLLLEVEEFIDNELLLQHRANGPIKIIVLLKDFMILEHWNTATETMGRKLIDDTVVKELKSRYEEFGWEKVRIFYDAKTDNTCITLEAFTAEESDNLEQNL